MKTLSHYLLISALLASFCSLGAAEPAAVVTDAGNCYVDGQNVGAPADAIANRPELAPRIQVALAEFVARTIAQEKARADAAIAAKEAEKAATIAAKEAEKAASITAAEKARDDAIAAHSQAKESEINTLRAEKEAKAAEAKEKADALVAAKAELDVLKSRERQAPAEAAPQPNP
jgi:hypothetical protein